MTEAHAKYPPSGMARTLLCPAWIQASEGVPSTSSGYAEHGTMLHGWVPRVMKQGRYILNTPKCDLTQEDKQYVLMCADFMDMILLACGPNAKVYYEVKVSLESFGLPDVWGTADVIIDDTHDEDHNDVYSIDWKFGQGVPEHAYKNKQLMTYAAGYMGFPQTFDGEIHIWLVQPPLNIEEEYVCDYDELKDFVLEEVVPAIQQAKSLDAPFNPGEYQCRFCPRKNDCPSRHEHMKKKSLKMFQTARFRETVSDEELIEAIEIWKEYSTYGKALMLYIEGEVFGGRKQLPGYKVVEGRSIRKWKDTKAAAQWLSESVIADHMYISKMVSPAQAEKLHRTMRKNKEFQQLIEKPPGKPQLVVESDKRPAINPQSRSLEAFKDHIE